MTKPNVLLLTVDTLRADMLGCYGHSRPTTPHIDRLAAKGVRFEYAISGGSWTQAAFPTILTSSHASMYGGCLGPLAPERPAPIESLAAHGYETAAFTTSPLLGRAYGYQRGFDRHLELTPAGREPLLRRLRGGQNLLRHDITHRLAALFGRRLRPARLYVPAEEVSAQVGRWLETAKAPFFGWAHYMDVHWPYHQEEALSSPANIGQAWRDLGRLYRVNRGQISLDSAERQRLIGLYEQAVGYTDAQIGRLIERLDALGLRANTVIILLADHGEEFLERKHWGHFETNLHDEIVRVPLLITGPGVAQGQVVTRQVSTLDIMPTILELCGVPARGRLEGTSLAPLWSQGSGVYAVDEAISERWRHEQHLIAIRTPAYKYIWDSRRPEQPRLYDLAADPGERRDVAAEHGEQLRVFQSRLERHLARVAQTAPAADADAPELDEVVMRRLQDLGYVE
ncbi:MAG: sulfatase [Candidatus Promineifilaceae bacterium]